MGLNVKHYYNSTTDYQVRIFFENDYNEDAGLRIEYISSTGESILAAIPTFMAITSSALVLLAASLLY